MNRSIVRRPLPVVAIATALVLIAVSFLWGAVSGVLFWTGNSGNLNQFFSGEDWIIFRYTVAISLAMVAVGLGLMYRRKWAQIGFAALMVIGLIPCVLSIADATIVASLWALVFTVLGWYILRAPSSRLYFNS